MTEPERRLNQDPIQVHRIKIKEGAVYATLSLSQRDYENLLADRNGRYSLGVDVTSRTLLDGQKKGPCFECGNLVPTDDDMRALSHEVPISIDGDATEGLCKGSWMHTAPSAECGHCGQVIQLTEQGRYVGHHRYAAIGGRAYACEGSNTEVVHPNQVPEDLPIGGHKPPRVVHVATGKKRRKGLCGAKTEGPHEPGPNDVECTRCLLLAIIRMGKHTNENFDNCRHNAKVLGDLHTLVQEVVEHVKVLEADAPHRNWLDEHDAITLRLERLEKGLAKVRRPKKRKDPRG